MRILMFTNTFTPHVGGVARSVSQFAAEYTSLGHQVLIVAPFFPDTPEQETGVVRIPAVQRFNGTDFSIPVPIPGYLWQEIDDFDPHIVHSHHPFLLGDTALRVSSTRDVPVIFTHHTQYEKYTHYVPDDSPAMKRFVVDLAVGYCNLCDAVIAPSDTIRQRLLKLGVKTETHEIPTGVDTELFGNGDGATVRRRSGIAEDAFVVGHVGRLAPEKGLEFLSQAVAQFVHSHSNTVFLVVGTGPSTEPIRQTFEQFGLGDRLVMLGKLERQELANAYAAMDVFAFASQSETQGMVLTEAMAASTPVVAVDASGVREVMQDGTNGFMIPLQDLTTFVKALGSVYHMPDEQKKALQKNAHATAEAFSMPTTAAKAMQLYRSVIRRGRRGIHGHDLWTTTKRRLKEEWKIWSNVAQAMKSAFEDSPNEDVLQ